MQFKKTVTVSKKIADRLQALLDKTEVNFEKEMVDTDATLLTLTAKFDDQVEADIKVCSGQNNCYVDAVLFDKGSEVCVSETCEKLLGDFYFTYKGNEYIVTLEVE